MSLKDEPPFVNAAVWNSVFQHYSVFGKNGTVSLLGVTGKSLSLKINVVHLVAKKTMGWCI